MTPKPPRKATPSSSRSATKPAKQSKARKPGQPYDEATRAKAVAMLEAQGMAETHRRMKIPKGSLSRWARTAGVDLGDEARARTSTATEAVRARAAEVTLSTVALLEHHVAQAGDLLATVVGVNALAARRIAAMDPADLKRVATLAGTVVLVEDPAVDEVLRVAEAMGALPLAVRDAEGILTRAIHDLQLLNGEATERGELVVEFAIPRPVAIPAADVATYSTTED